METSKYSRLIPTCSTWSDNQMSNMTFLQDPRSDVECWGKWSYTEKSFCCLSHSGNQICVCAYSCLRKKRLCRAPCLSLQEKSVSETICVWWFSCFQSLWYVVHTVVDSSTKTLAFFSARWCLLFHVFWTAGFYFPLPLHCSTSEQCNTVPERLLYTKNIISIAFFGR